VDPDEGGVGNGGKMLDRRLADDLIRWVHNQKAGAPDKPFMIYYAPGSTHAPHQAPPEYIARFKGQFDQGWDTLREQTLRRQIAAGIVPKGTRLTPRPAEIPAWSSLSPGEKAYSARAMEVAASQLAYQDEQFGHTLVALIIGDNGSSAEGSPKGAFNELRAMGSDDESEAFTHATIDKLGGPTSYENYAAGWALAMNTPLRWSKQYASMLGGIRDGMILSWPGHVAHPGEVCSQFGHLVDIGPNEGARHGAEANGWTEPAFQPCAVRRKEAAHTIFRDERQGRALSGRLVPERGGRPPFVGNGPEKRAQTTLPVVAL
jgi:arylsulfatase